MIIISRKIYRQFVDASQQTNCAKYLSIIPEIEMHSDCSFFSSNPIVLVVCITLLYLSALREEKKDTRPRLRFYLPFIMLYDETLIYAVIK